MYFKALEVNMKDKLLASDQKLISTPGKAREEFNAKIDMPASRSSSREVRYHLFLNLRHIRNMPYLLNEMH